MNMERQSINGLFSPEEYADLVAETDTLVQNGRSTDDVIQVLTDRIIAAFERKIKMERRAAQLKGIADARSRGVHLGRPRMEPPANFPLVLKQHMDGNITATMAANLCGVGVSTFYRMKREAENGSVGEAR